MVQNVNFSLVGQNSDLSLKLNSTHSTWVQGCARFPKQSLRCQDIEISCKLKIILLTLKNVIFNRSLFVNSETSIGFMVSKRVQKWSQILILNLGWRCSQIEATLTGNFHSLSQKMWLFTNGTKHRQIICHRKLFSSVLI